MQSKSSPSNSTQSTTLINQCSIAQLSSIHVPRLVGPTLDSIGPFYLILNGTVGGSTGFFGISVGDKPCKQSPAQALRRHQRRLANGIFDAESRMISPLGVEEIAGVSPSRA
ncbi:hypothetical protein K432DRAFT_386763 [Lepidopterella palustris CBS 459.81]|uniref:Uncharacterized protein n=1 Tax=Lepidopterella palustris CBS 459.81 TaxID=1314670 RepID=A0A8E2J9L0_9PEZI|nr:hypothetical protein K432DRAFT_386763 [Lepidopterella palustris CBS 459.81]